MKRSNRVTLIACCILAGAAVEALAQTRPSLPNFCMGWERVCLRNCKEANCQSLCSGRRASCNSSGVFPFNNTGPRRYASCEDRGLVVSAQGKLFRDIPGWKCP